MKNGKKSNKLILIGAGGHAKSVIDILVKEEYSIMGFSDVKSVDYRGIKTICKDNELSDLFNSGVNYAFICVGAIANTVLRDKIYKNLKTLGFVLPNIVHKSAILANNCTIGEGNFIGAGVIINSGVKIGNNCLINTGSIVEHEVSIADSVHIAPRVTVCGGVSIASGCFIGAAATILENRTIAARTIIGAGSLVNKNINQENSKGFGVPFSLISINTQQPHNLD